MNEREHLCTACVGIGMRDPRHSDRLCEHCDGSGHHVDDVDGVDVGNPCEHCDGTGGQWSYFADCGACEHCDGTGQEPCPPKGDVERALRRAEGGAK